MKTSINALKMLGITMINKANSGHPGIVLSAAPMLYVLFTNHLKFNPSDPKWINRDRFVLSAGHGSALLYSCLHLAGYNITISDLKKFRQINSITPGHPEYNLTPGIEVTTGPLGQGIANAVGMAIAEQYLSTVYNNKKYIIFNHNTYAICGDGDLQEGVALEAISLAGRLKLKKLIILHDSNDVQLDNMVAFNQIQNMKLFFESNQWDYIKVNDGDNVNAINDAINDAKNSKKPSFIEIKTIIGEGATKQGTPAVHGAPLGNDIDTVKKYLNWKYDDFEVPQKVYDDFSMKIINNNKKNYHDWQLQFNHYKKMFPSKFKTLSNSINNNFNINYKNYLHLKPTQAQATRSSSGQILQEISKDNKNIIGGSADLGCSTKAIGNDGYFLPPDYTGRNISYGVREFAMGAVNNGINTHYLKSFSGTFFSFLDYMKGSVRLSSLMDIPSIFIYTHDSVCLGEDGPTHQPIEHLAMLRAQPNINVYRPADFNEVLGCYDQIFKTKKTPSALVLSRQNLPQLTNSDPIQIKNGGYLIWGNQNANICLISTGSEVHLAIDVAKMLKSKNNLDVKVVSMVCWELFTQQTIEYQKQVVFNSKYRISIELGSSFGWTQFAQLVIGIDKFGYSAKQADILEKVGFTPIKIHEKIFNFINNN